MNLWGGTSRNLELCSGGWFPCKTGFLPYVSVLGTHMYHCTSWYCCEKWHSASVNFFFKDSVKVFTHFMTGDLQGHLPTPCGVFNIFWPKMSWPSMPYPRYSPDLNLSDLFFVSTGWKESSKGNISTDVEEVRPKMAEPLKASKLTSSKNVLSCGKKNLGSCIASREYFEGDWSLNM